MPRSGGLTKPSQPRTRRGRARFGAALLLAALAACAKPALPELQALYAADDADRASRSLPDGELWAREESRLKAVLAARGAGRLKTPEERFLAASILAHGHSPEQFLLGHELALSAAKDGWRQARWLAAANQDRYRVAVGKPQLYGTQFEYDASKGRWALYPVEPSLSDAERAQWDVRPLAESRRLAGELAKEGLSGFQGRLERARERAILDELHPSSAPSKAPASRP